MLIRYLSIYIVYPNKCKFSIFILRMRTVRIVNISCHFESSGTTKVQLSLKMLWFCYPFNQQWHKTWWKPRYASPMGMTDAKFCFKYNLCVCSQAVLHAAFCSGSCMLQSTTRFRYIVCLCIVLLWLLWRRARLLAAWSVFVTDRSLDTAGEGAGALQHCRGEVWSHSHLSRGAKHTPVQLLVFLPKAVLQSSLKVCVVFI